MPKYIVQCGCSLLQWWIKNFTGREVDKKLMNDPPPPPKWTTVHREKSGASGRGLRIGGDMNRQ